MDIKLEIYSPEEMRVLASTLQELADITEKQRNESHMKWARVRDLWSDADNSAKTEQAPAIEAPTPASAEDKPAKKARAKKEEPAPTPPAAETAPSEVAAPAPAAESRSEITLVDVRAKLAALSQAGKAASVKGLLSDFGVAKLTDLPAQKYSELMAAAEEI